MYLVLSTSLKHYSRSRVLARHVHEHIQTATGHAKFVDLRDYPLPFCDAGECYATPNVQHLAGFIKEARGILIASPIYNYDVNSAAKNLLELTGKVWEDKLVGFLCAAGGNVSYMAPMGFANSLMLDFRCLIVPRFVYAIGAHFDGEKIVDPKIVERVQELATTMVRMADKLYGPLQKPVG